VPCFPVGGDQGIANAVVRLIIGHSCCYMGGSWRFCIEWGCSFPGWLSNRIGQVQFGLVLIWQLCGLLCCNSGLPCLPAGRDWHLDLVYCRASHHPLVCSGRCCIAGIQCQAILFSFVRKMSISFLLRNYLMTLFLLLLFHCSYPPKFCSTNCTVCGYLVGCIVSPHHCV